MGHLFLMEREFQDSPSRGESCWGLAVEQRPGRGAAASSKGPLGVEERPPGLPGPGRRPPGGTSAQISGVEGAAGARARMEGERSS